MRPRHFAEEIAHRFATGREKASCFNEASAFRRGNRRSSSANNLLTCSFNEASAFRRGNRRSYSWQKEISAPASMRPRHFAEEITVILGWENIEGPASMRPRHFAEEIGFIYPCPDCAGEASMRPRHFAEEIQTESRKPPARIARFNEASAFRRGNPGCSEQWLTRQPSFNEASAFRRGNPWGSSV